MKHPPVSFASYHFSHLTTCPEHCYKLHTRARQLYPAASLGCETAGEDQVIFRPLGERGWYPRSVMLSTLVMELYTTFPVGRGRPLDTIEPLPSAAVTGGAVDCACTMPLAAKAESALYWFPISCRAHVIDPCKCHQDLKTWPLCRRLEANLMCISMGGLQPCPLSS